MRRDKGAPLASLAARALTGRSAGAFRPSIAAAAALGSGAAQISHRADDPPSVALPFRRERSKNCSARC
jgi:hypothetical protein